MHGNADTNITKLRPKIRMSRDYLVNRLCIQKINLKRPLSRGSRFKIYFHLECRENRGSRQNFHRIPFFKDHLLINPDHFVTLSLHAYVKIEQFKPKQECQNILRKLINSYRKCDLNK